MDGKLSLYRKCCFPDCKNIVNKDTFAGFRGTIAPPWIRPTVKLVTIESTRFDNKDSEPKAQVRLLSSQKKIKFFQKHI